MRRLNSRQRILIAEFFANIGVGWFTAGVIGSIFVSGTRNIAERMTLGIGGLLLSIMSLYIGFYVLRKRVS